MGPGLPDMASARRTRIIFYMASACRTRIAIIVRHAVPMDTSGARLLNDTQWADEVLLPHRPYATNYLDRGQYRMNRDDALTMRYVEPPPLALLGSIGID